MHQALLTAFVAATLLAASGCSQIPSSTTDLTQVELQVMARFQSLVDAARSLDTPAYLRHFDQRKFSSLNEDGTVTSSYPNFRDAFTAGTGHIERYEKLTFAPVKVIVIDRLTAILINEYEATVTLKSGQLVHVRGAGSQVWNRASGEWLLVSVSSSNKSSAG